MPGPARVMRFDAGHGTLLALQLGSGLFDARDLVGEVAHLPGEQLELSAQRGARLLARLRLAAFRLPQVVVAIHAQFPQ